MKWLDPARVSVKKVESFITVTLMKVQTALFFYILDLVMKQQQGSVSLQCNPPRIFFFTSSTYPFSTSWEENMCQDHDKSLLQPFVRVRAVLAAPWIRQQSCRSVGKYRGAAGVHESGCTCFCTHPQEPSSRWCYWPEIPVNIFYKWGSRLIRGRQSAAKRLIVCLITNILHGFVDTRRSVPGKIWPCMYCAKISPS